MKTDNALMTVAIIAVIVSIVGAGITYSHLANFRNKVTGFATDLGYVNLTVEESVSLNFTTASVNWGSGRVNDGASSALLDTTNYTAANVTNGNWTGNSAGLVLENIGNKNVTLELKATSDNASFIGGTAGSGPLFNWRFNATEANSCVNATPLNLWAPVNTTGDGTLVCDYFNYLDALDQLRIDFFVRIPSDSITGARGNTITATFAAA